VNGRTLVDEPNQSITANNFSILAYRYEAAMRNSESCTYRSRWAVS
jgi:hypothetical protein